MEVSRLARRLVLLAAIVGCDVVIRPVPPGPRRFMWQNVQSLFTRNGEPCIGRVTLAVSERAVCYAASDGDLHCAGAVYQRDFGTRFAPTGLGDIDQVFLSGTWNTPTGNGMCLLRHDGKVYCMGDANPHGEFGVGTREPTERFVPWEVPKTLARMATGTWNQLCAVDTGDMVRCAGRLSDDCSTYRDADRPTVQDGGQAHRTLWLDECARRHFDPVPVFRVSAGQTMCRVRQEGLSCYEYPNGVPWAVFGEPGKVVDGFTTDLSDRRQHAAYECPEGRLSATVICWLTPTGKARCRCATSDGVVTSWGPTAEPFGQEILALAGDYQTDTVCTAKVDGSLWCLGTNANGQLGTGDREARKEAEMVRPPGSVRVPHCSRLVEGHTWGD